MAISCALTPLLAATTQEQKGLETLKDTSRGFSVAAKKAMPAVVSIKATSGSSSQRGSSPLDDSMESPYDDLIRRFFGLPPSMGMRERQFAPSFGSGFIISSDGYILTNNHVLRNADEISVTLHDESEKRAKLIGRDIDTDLAVIKIEGKDLPFLDLGNSDSIDIGDWVIAIGSPSMLNSTLTVGVVSAKGRNNLHLNLIEGYIQTDAAINPGNSGGPLLNIDGQVIGINTAIASNTGSYVGIGFAIPSNIANQVSEQLIQNGAVRRVVLGISVKNVDSDIAKTYGADKPDGVIIINVNPESAADKGGLKWGDIISSLDGQSIKNHLMLRSLLTLKKPGTVVQVEVIRDRKKITLPITLEADALKISTSLASKAFGFEFEDSNVKSAEGEKSGVVISAVEVGSPAWTANIRKGSTLLAINTTKVQSATDCKPLLEKAVKENYVLLLIQEGSTVRFVPIKARS